LAQTRDTPGVIALPPLLFGGALGLGLLLHYAFALPGLGLPGGGRRAFGIILILAGGGLLAAALRRFRAAGTHVSPTQPATALVVTGIYRFTRNPMYVGLSLVYAGIALLADSLVTLLLLAPLLAVIRYGVIAREERYMEAKFGNAYRDYRARVRRWA
jgi:protein-S-isoprenylcysteine O-methyltransferase Ste14